MKEFDTWLKFSQDGWVKDADGKTWPSFGCLTTRDEAECAEFGWKAALEWVLNEGIDNWLEDTIKEELNAKT